MPVDCGKAFVKVRINRPIRVDKIALLWTANMGANGPFRLSTAPPHSSTEMSTSDVDGSATSPQAIPAHPHAFHRDVHTGVDGSGPLLADLASTMLRLWPPLTVDREPWTGESLSAPRP